MTDIFKRAEEARKRNNERVRKLRTKKKKSSSRSSKSDRLKKSIELSAKKQIEAVNNAKTNTEKAIANKKLLEKLNKDIEKRRDNKLRINVINAKTEKRKVDKILKSKDYNLTSKQKNDLIKYKQEVDNYTRNVDKYLKDKKVFNSALIRAKKGQLSSKEIINLAHSNADMASQLSKINRQSKQTNNTFKLATYEQVFGGLKKIKVPKERSLLTKNKIRAPKIDPLKFEVKFNLDLKRFNELKRAVKGEKILDVFPNFVQPIVQSKDGKTRQMTKSELKEYKNLMSDEVTLNPLNLVTGFFGGTKDIATLIRNPNLAKDQAKELITHPVKSSLTMIEDLSKNPFGFIGESYAYGKAGDLLFKTAKYSARPLRKLRTPNINREKFLTKEIKKLERKGVNIRARTLESKKLKLYKEELGIIKKDLIDLNKMINTLERPKKLKTPKLTAKQIIKDIKPVQDRFKKRNLKRKKIQKQYVKLKDTTKAKKLGEFFKETQKSKPRLKLKKKLPTDKKLLLEIVEKTYKFDSQNFKKLKSKIKKEQNLNVVRRKNKFVLLEPKVNKKAGKLTGKKTKPKVIKLEKLKTPKQKEINLYKEEKRTYKQKIKDIEFKEGQNLDKLQKDIKKIAVSEAKITRIEARINIPKSKSILRNKKAQMTFQRTFKRHYKNVQTQTKKLKSNYQKLKYNYKKFNKKHKTIKTKAQRETYMRDLKKLKKQSKDFIKESKQIKLKLNKLQSLIKLAVGIGLMSKVKSINSQINTQKLGLDNQIKEIMKSINDFEKPIKLKTPKRPTKPKTKLKKITKTPIRTKTPTPTTPKPIKPQTKAKQIIKPIKKPKLIPQQKQLQTQTTKGKLAKVTFKIGNKTKTINTNLPFNKGLAFAKDVLDNTLLASMTVTAYGKTKKKDIRKPNLKKFGLKVGKNPLVQKVVEKRKYRLDTKGEKKEIQVKNYIKKKLKLKRL